MKKLFGVLILTFFNYGLGQTKGDNILKSETYFLNDLVAYDDVLKLSVTRAESRGSISYYFEVKGRDGGKTVGVSYSTLQKVVQNYHLLVEKSKRENSPADYVEYMTRLDRLNIGYGIDNDGIVWFIVLGQKDSIHVFDKHEKIGDAFIRALKLMEELGANR